MDGIKRVKSANMKNRRQTQRSATLNRRFVKQPASTKKITTRTQSKNINKATKSSAVSTNKTARSKSSASNIAKRPVKKQKRSTTQIDKNARARTVGKISQMERNRKASIGTRQLSSRELKERAIEQALQNAKASSGRQGNFSKVIENEGIVKKQAFWKRKGVWATALVVVLAIGAIGTFVYFNLPDLTVKVAAIRNGFDSRFPSYLPAGYETDSIDSGDGKITMKFRNGDKTFSVVEEKSTWDSATVRANLVEKDWGQTYEIMKGQGLTIYVADKGSAWVNGGILYTILNENSDLSKEQIHGIAVSL